MNITLSKATIAWLLYALGGLILSAVCASLTLMAGAICLAVFILVAAFVFAIADANL